MLLVWGPDAFVNTSTVLVLLQGVSATYAARDTHFPRVLGGVGAIFMDMSNVALEGETTFTGNSAGDYGGE